MEAVLNGPSGQVMLGSAVLTFGRLPDNTIVMTDVKASGHHAEVRPTAQGYMVVDLGSTNGTFVNGMQLTPHVPQELKTFDVIRIGDVSYTYQISGASGVAPTIYASPAQGSSPGYQPTVVAPPATAYGGYVPQQDYQAYEAGSASVPYAPTPQNPYPSPPPPVYDYGQQPAGAPGYMAQPQGVPNYGAAPAPARTQNKRNLYIGGGVLAAVVVGVILFVVLSASSPSKTLGTFCDALSKRDYQTAYDTLSANQKSKGSEASFAQNLGSVTISVCSSSNVQQNGSTATADLVLGSSLGITQTYKATLVNENGAWKIDNLQLS
jgi:hypothetical protein